MLARLMAEGTQRGCEALYEAFERFLEDREAIERHFVGDFSRLRRLSTGMGTLIATVGGARAGVRLRRPARLQAQIVGDRRALLPAAVLVERAGVEPAFESPRVLDRGPYGWQEFVAAAPCRDLEGSTASTVDWAGI